MSLFSKKKVEPGILSQRMPIRIGMFYPDNAKDCETELKNCIPDAISGLTIDKVIAGLVPHAGWAYSGHTAGCVYRAIAQTNPNPTFVFFGSVHVYGIRKSPIYGKGSWITPLGDVYIEADLAQKILAMQSPFMEEKPDAHQYEHSIEVQIPFLKYLFPKSKFVPIMVSSWNEAVEIGKAVASVSGPDVVALASADLTHYGERFGFEPAGTGLAALNWVKQVNDRRMIDLVLSMQAEKIPEEGEQNNNSCGAGAIASMVAFAREKQKQTGQLLHYTTSWDVEQRREARNFVGYAGIAF